MNDLMVARGLHKTYINGEKRLQVLKGIDLVVSRGKILVIIGPSGAGKSTLLHLLGGLDPPTSGVVLLDGASIYDLSDSERAELRGKRIGFVFQFYHLLPELSAFENVMLPALIAKGSGATSERARSMLDSVGLGHRMDCRPDQLSGGEQQRVAIVRALINDPDIVFCDEPTGNLDSSYSHLICDLIQRLSKERQQTFVIVSHEEAMVKLTEQVYRIKDGLLW